MHGAAGAPSWRMFGEEDPANYVVKCTHTAQIYDRGQNEATVSTALPNPLADLHTNPTYCIVTWFGFGLGLGLG